MFLHKTQREGEEIILQLKHSLATTWAAGCENFSVSCDLALEIDQSQSNYEYHMCFETQVNLKPGLCAIYALKDSIFVGMKKEKG